MINGVHVIIQPAVAHVDVPETHYVFQEGEGWGLLSQLTLPGGGRLGLFELRHDRP